MPADDRWHLTWRLKGQMRTLCALLDKNQFHAKTGHDWPRGKLELKIQSFFNLDGR